MEFSYGYPSSDADTIVVSEEVCMEYLRLACDKYLQRHPENKAEVDVLLSESHV